MAPEAWTYNGAAPEDRVRPWLHQPKPQAGLSENPTEGDMTAANWRKLEEDIRKLAADGAWPNRVLPRKRGGGDEGRLHGRKRLKQPLREAPAGYVAEAVRGMKRRVTGRTWLRTWKNIVWFPVQLLAQLFHVLVGTVMGRSATYENAMRDLDRACRDVDKAWLIVTTTIALMFMLTDPVIAAPLPQDYRYPGEENPSYHHFSVYDCEDRRTRFKSLDLTTTEACPDPSTDYQEKYSSRVMILQTDAKTLVDVYACQAYFDKEITVCGKLHADYGSERVAIHDRVKVSAEQCREWVKTMKYNTDSQALGGPSQMINLVEGEWVHKDYFSHGQRGEHGRCKWDSWYYKGKQHTKAYEVTSVKARIRKITGVINVDTGTMSVTNGLHVNFADGTVLDGVEGTMVWKREATNCTEGISLLYDGPVDIHRLDKKISKKKKTKDPMAGAIVVMENLEEKQTGAFIVKAQKASCLPQCHTTHIPGLLICFEPHRIKDRFVYKPGERQDIKTVMAAVTHTRVTGSFDTGKKFSQIQSQLCDVSLEGKLHQLSDIAGNSNAYALRKLVIPGVGVRGRKYIPGGAAGYVASCPEVNGTLYQFGNCTLQIPILLSHQLGPNATKEVFFADPITMVVQKFPTVIPCSKSLPIRWLIQDTWFCSSPTITKCDAPIRVGTDLDMAGMGPTEDEFDVMGGILYSNKQQSQNDAFQRSLDYRDPIVQNIINNMAKGATLDSQGNLHFGTPFDADQIDDIAFRVTGTVFFMFAWMGRYYTVVIGALFFGAILKLVVGVGLRFYFMYRKKGCGIWLITALWHTAFLVFGMPWKLAKGVYTEAIQEVDKANLEVLAEPGQYNQVSEALKKVAVIQDQQQDMIYQREEKLNNLLRAISKSDHNLAGYAATMLAEGGRENNRENSGTELKDFNPTAPTQNKGSNSGL